MSKLSNMLINEQFKTVLFDVDGTLFDTLPSLSAANNLVLKQAGLLEVATPLLRPALNEGLRAMFRKSIDLQMVPVDDELVMVLEKEFLQQYMQDWLAAATFYPHLHEALAALKKLGLKLGICTNRDRASTEYLLAQSRIAEFFELIVGLGDAPHPKPAADPLLLALERMGGMAADALFVGDSSIDATCARLAHVRFAGHLGGYAVQSADLEPNVFVFSDYGTLANWIVGHQAASDGGGHS